MNMNTKIEELLAVLKKKEDDKQKNTVLWVLAIIGAVAADIRRNHRKSRFSK